MVRHSKVFAFLNFIFTPIRNTRFSKNPQTAWPRLFIVTTYQNVPVTDLWQICADSSSYLICCLTRTLIDASITWPLHTSLLPNTRQLTCLFKTSLDCQSILKSNIPVLFVKLYFSYQSEI